jgi:hypothetical protein
MQAEQGMAVRAARVMSVLGVALLTVFAGGANPLGQSVPGYRPLGSVDGRRAASFASLTPADYIEIRQLVSRYAYAVDTGADNGNVYADLFAADGAFVDRQGRETTGREALAALARRNTRGPQAAFHFIVNHVIEPAPGGATGREYLLQLRIGDGERLNDVFGGGQYDDVYVKTAEGWRFRRRQFLPSEGSPAPRRPAEALR